MPLTPFTPPPGLFNDGTSYSVKGTWNTGDKIRFRGGFPEKMGGWTKATTAAFNGVCRHLVEWADLSNVRHIGAGTTSKFYVENSSGVLLDRTPLRAMTLPANPLATTNASPTLTVSHQAHGRSAGDKVLISGAADTGGFTAASLNTVHTIATTPTADTYTITMGTNATGTVAAGGGTLVKVYYRATFSVPLTSNPFTTTNGSALVTVRHDNHGAAAGDFVSFSGASAVNNITLSGEYAVTSVTDANNYVVTATTTANASGSGGGATVAAMYFLSTGQASFSYGTGWGSGGWGSGGWGAGTASGFGQSIRLWSSAPYGEDLLVNPRGGAIYHYDQSADTRLYDIRLASGATSVPVECNFLLVSPEDRRPIAFGCTDLVTGVKDPLLIRWSDDGDFVNWAPGASTAAGEIRLSIGSEIVCAARARSEILVWTENSLTSMRFMEDFIFGSSLVSPNVDIVGPNAVAVVDDAVYWMGQENFFLYNGRAQTIPCSVREYVFGDINMGQKYKICASTNRLFREIRWDYPSSTAEENDRYVIFNYAENAWYYGTMVRTAWSDAGFRTPIAAGTDGYLYAHESGLNDGSTNPPSAITAYVESAPVEIEDGSSFFFMSKAVPDVSFSGSTVASPSVDMTIKSRKYPGSATGTGNTRTGAVTKVSATVDEATQKISLRVRGRQFRVRVESDDLNVAWRLGVQRFELRPDGRKV